MRWFFVLVIFLILTNCKQSKDQKQSFSSTSDTVAIDTTQEIQINDFDELVNDYEDPTRVNWQNPEIVFSKMGDLRGKVVADIGTGTGYFAFRLIRKGATVIGIDIEPKFLDYIEDRKAEIMGDLKDRITTRLSKENDPELSPNEVDFVLIVNTYYFLSDKNIYLKKVRNGIKNGGKLIVVDYKIGNIPVGPPESVKVSAKEASSEIASQGFTIREIDTESLQYQYIIIAEK